MKTQVNYSREDLNKDLCCRAYAWRSFDPEKAGERERDGYVSTMDNFLGIAEKIAITEEQKEQAILTLKWIKEEVIKKMTAYLYAGSNCASPMITGPAKFNYDRNEKKNNSYQNRVNEYLEFIEKAKKILIDKIYKLTPQEAITSNELAKAKRCVDDLVSCVICHKNQLLKTNAKNRLLTVCKNNPTIIDEVIKEIRKQEANRKITIFTKNNKIWEEFEKLKVKAEQPKENKEFEINGVKAMINREADRLQLFFYGKPSDEIRGKLKSKGFHWSPFYTAWQRKLTQQAIFDAKNILKGE